jgi:hypothetical protein
VSLNIDVTMGTYPAAQEAVLVHHAWKKRREAVTDEVTRGPM